MSSLVMRLSTALCAAALGLLSASPAPAAPPAVLSGEHARALDGLIADPPPAKLIDSAKSADSGLPMHFVTTNEKRLERYREVLGDRGGMHVGVGAGQNYLFIGWARSEVAVLLDFDQVIVDLHDVYRTFFLNATTADELIALWAPPRAEESRALITRFAADPARRQAALEAFELARFHVYGQLLGQQRRFRLLKVATFLTDQAQYDHIVGLWRTGRLRTVRGDLTADQAMKSVGRAARALGVPVRTVYFSNAEEYFSYDSGIRDNMAALPGDERSLVMRTAYDPGANDFAYGIQTLSDFRAWLALPNIKMMHQMVRQARGRVVRGLWQLPGPPPEQVAAVQRSVSP